MQSLFQRRTCLLMSAAAMILLPGCVNWQQKYEYLNVELENAKGRLLKCHQDRQQLSGRISEDQRTIEELTRQIEELNRTPAQATRFDGLDVAFDPSRGTITETLPNTILFASGKAVLKRGMPELDHVVSVLKSNYPSRKVDVVGHTDTDPIKKSGWKDNWELSAERALAVTRYLVKQGVPSRLVRACGAGSARPVAANSGAASKAKNRRVEIVVYLK